MMKKLLESNATANFILYSAEQSVHAAVSLAEPVFVMFQKPLMVTDSLICTTIDKIAESNAKAKEARQKVTDVIVNLPVKSAINCAKAVKCYSVEKVGHFVVQMHHQQHPNNEEQRNDETIPPETEPGIQDQSTQTVMSSCSVRERIEFFSKMSTDVRAQIC